MLGQLKSISSRLKSYRSGERFQSYHRYRKGRGAESACKFWLWISVAFLLIIVGVAFAFLPVLPGFLFAIPGLAILAARYKSAAMTLDRSEVFIRRIVRKIGRSSSSPDKHP